jgi:hypothetical protein
MLVSLAKLKLGYKKGCPRFNQEERKRSGKTKREKQDKVLTI